MMLLLQPLTSDGSEGIRRAGARRGDGQCKREEADVPIIRRHCIDRRGGCRMN